MTTSDGHELDLATASREALAAEVERLRASFEEYQSRERDLVLADNLFGNLHDTYYRTDLQGRLVVASRSGQDVFGYMAEDVVGLNLARDFYVDPSEREGFLELLKKHGSVRDFEARLRRKDGSIIWVSTNASWYRGPGGGIAGVEGITRDITDRKAAEEALRRSEMEYRALVETARSVILRLDSNGVIMFANVFAHDFFGYERGELVGRNVTGTIIPIVDSAGNDLTGLIQRVVAEPEQYLVNENENIRRNGERVWLVWANKPFLDSDGRVAEILCIGNDATKRKRTEDSLRASEDRYRLVAENVSDVIWACGMDGCFNFVTPSIEQISGFTAREVLGNHFTSLLSEESAARARSVLDERLADFDPLVQFPVTLELGHIHKDGGVRLCEIQARFQRDEKGAPIGIVGVTRDITARKMAEAELEQTAGAMRVLEHEVKALRSDIRGRYGLDRIIGGDPKMRAVYETVLAVSPTDATVLIHGDTGTGKERVAKAIHYNSVRSGGPFVKVDCGALAENLLETELFGHVRGAFTGAVKERVGRFEVASGGTIFLDEVQNLSWQLQAKLLRLTQEGVYERVGGQEVVAADVRIVAATNADLSAMVGRQEFRRDLYYRLNVIPIHLPPLRERSGDIPRLAANFVSIYAERHGRPAKSLSKEALDRLMGYHWPGNVRELENVCEQAVIFCNSSLIGPEELRLPAGGASVAEPGGSADEPKGAMDGRRMLREALNGPEKTMIQNALEAAAGNRTKAAKILGISRSVLYDRIKRHGIGRT